MGMFDSIKCSYPLPEVKGLQGWNLNIQEIEYQTKDMDNVLGHYYIKENGELWWKDQKFKWVDDDNAFLKGYLEVESSEDKPANYHGILNFYCYEDLGEKDGKFYIYTSEYNAKFSDNVLVNLEVVEAKVEDVTESKLKTQAFWKKHDEKRKKWYNKYFLHTKIIQKIRRMILRSFYRWYQLNQSIYYCLSRFL